MPYIKQTQRIEIEKVTSLNNIAAYFASYSLEDFVGALSYIIHTLTKTWLGRNGYNYFKLNSIIGTVLNSAHELQRRILDPYENTKINGIENGDV